MHPNLVKLYRYCCDTRLAVLFDEKFTGVVLLSDDFGWDERMKVVTQLADLFSCLHDNNIALGCVTPPYIMIDKILAFLIMPVLQRFYKELIAKRKFSFVHGFCYVETLIEMRLVVVKNIWFTNSCI